MVTKFLLATALTLSLMPPVNTYLFPDGTVEVAYKSRSIATALTQGANV